MEFRLLGPLEVSDEARPIAIGAGRRRALLVLLLLHIGEPMSADRLIEELWGASPPATARKVLQGCIVDLRKALGADAIATGPAGYELRLAGELDLHRFERLVADGRAALAAGDAATAAAQLDEALRLWRGPPLADVAYEPFAPPECARLEELRLGALEDRIDADLQLGRQADAVPELERLVADHPLRERLQGQLMLALYRCGRQGDALAAYQAARRTLVEELGIEPGPELQSLQGLVLAQDPSLRAAAPPVPVRRHEERKLVTVLWGAFAPAPALEHDPERLRLALELATERVRACVEAAGGTLEPAPPGALLATFGAETAQEDHARRAVEAARAAHAAVGTDTGLALGIGIESGEIVVGPPQSGGPAGAAIAAAARLAAAAGPGELRLGPRATPSGDGPRRGLRELGSVFVGREAELELLAATRERAIDARRPHLVAVVGDAGVGKTSLVRALRKRAGAGDRWYVGRCRAYGHGVTYHALAQVLRAHVGLRDDAAPEAVVERLGERSILGLMVGTPPSEELHPWEARARLEEAWLAVAEELAAEGPAILLIEDAHWAEDALLDLLDLVVRRASGRLLVLVTGRPELLTEHPAFGTGRGNASTLWLDPLPADTAAAMLSALAGDLPESARRLVLEAGEGNPFFVEEALGSLLDRGALRREAGGWVAYDLPAALPASDSVQAVIASRIDLLPDAVREVLLAASVAGRRFWEGAVRALVDRPPSDLELLEDRDFVRRRAVSSLAGERELVFKHALTREVAYASLPLARRARLHASFAEWVEQTTDAPAALLAHHYAEAVAPATADLAWRGEPAREADLRRRAVQWLRRAADVATGRYEIDDALALLHEAVAIATDDETKVELLRAEAWAHEVRYDTDRRRAALERALALAPPSAVQAQIYSRLAHAGTGPWLWRKPPPRTQVDEWIRHAFEHADPGSEAYAYASMALARADPRDGVEAAREAREIAERVGEPVLLHDAYYACAIAAEAVGAADEAGRWVDRMLAVRGRIRDPFHVESLLFAGSVHYLRFGRLAEARALAVEHDRVARPLSAHHEVHAVALDMLVEVTQGIWHAAVALAERAEAAAVANRETPCQFNWRTLTMGAYAAARAGDDAESRRLERRALEELVMGGPEAREPSALRLALLRDDDAAVAALLDADPGPSMWDVDYAAARLDALAALGRWDAVEREASRPAVGGGYTEPFALRALGLARGDAALVARAAAGFARIGIAWRADATRREDLPALTAP